MINRLPNPGQIIFAAGILCLGVFCIFYGDFIIGRPPAWPVGFKVTPIIGYVSGTIVILASLTILFVGKRAGAASLVIAALILILSILRQLPVFMNDWLNSYKAMALFGGALITASSFLDAHHTLFSKVTINVKTRRRFVTIGSVLLGVFFIAAGYAHFKFAIVVQEFIPSYIPFRVFWTYFTGVCLYAGGAGLIIPFTRSWAALLSGIMVMSWFLLLHIPRFLEHVNEANDRFGLCESFTFAGIFFVLYTSSSKK